MIVDEEGQLRTRAKNESDICNKMEVRQQSGMERV